MHRSLPRMRLAVGSDMVSAVIHWLSGCQDRSLTHIRGQDLDSKAEANCLSFGKNDPASYYAVAASS